jgi:Tfp pilus assembly protein FimT
VAIILVISIFALPSLQETQAVYRISGDARAIAQAMALAKLRAGAGFTRGRLSVDSDSGMFALEKYDKASTQFLPDGGAQYLNKGVSFGFGTITTPAGSQTSIHQSPTVTFNSRGIPIDDSGQPSADYAVYLNNSGHYYAVTVAMTGRIQVLQYRDAAWVTE